MVFPTVTRRRAGGLVYDNSCRRFLARVTRAAIRANSGSGCLGEISMSVSDTELRSAKCWIRPLHPEPRLVFRRI
jgi:hypothetical protein